MRGIGRWGCEGMGMRKRYAQRGSENFNARSSNGTEEVVSGVAGVGQGQGNGTNGKPAENSVHGTPPPKTGELSVDIVGVKRVDEDDVDILLRIYEDGFEMGIVGVSAKLMQRYVGIFLADEK